MIPRFKKGALVWYLQRDGTYREAKVVSVDVTVDPPSYAVELGESVRETESHRLQLRQAGEAPPSVPAQRPLAIPAGAPQQAALELEDDDFGDFADAAEAAQPNVSQLKAFTPSANGFSASGGGLSQLQPHSNGFSHATVAMNGLNGHAPPMHSGTAAYVPAAASQENGEDGFAAFVDADDLPPGPSVAGTQGAGQACSAQFALTGQPWPDPTKCTAAPAAVQLADQPAIHNLHASHQHARGPSAESSASLRSADDPASSVFSGGFPLGLLNGAKGERVHRVTPASTLAIAQEDLGSDSDEDFGDFEDAQPNVAWKSSAKPELLDRNAPIPLSLFGEEEDDSVPSEPALDLAAPWGGFLLPGQPWTSAVAEQEKAAAPQSAVTHAAHQPDGAVVPLPQQAIVGSAHEPADSVCVSAVPAQSPGLAAHVGTATSLATESSDSWPTAFTEASQALPSSTGVPSESAACVDAADAAELPSSHADQPSLQLQAAEVREHIDSMPRLLQATPTDGPEHATRHLQPGKPTADSADAAVSQHTSAVPAWKGGASPQAGSGGKGQIRTPSGSIDWSATGFDFGAPGSPVNAAAPAPQHKFLAPEQADRCGSAAVEADAKPSGGSAEEAPGSSSAAPEQALEPGSAARHADEEDDWEFGDFAGAAASLQDPSLESAAVGGLPALDLQNNQALSAPSVLVHSDSGKGAFATGIDTADSAVQEGCGDDREAAAVESDSADPDDGWGSWDAPEAAAQSLAPVTAELGGAPGLATGLPSPRLSAQLAPGGSGVLSFDQWGRAYSKLEQQVAKSGTGKPAATEEASVTPAADASMFELSEPPWGASQAPADDVWASLAALDDARALGDAADLPASQPPQQHAHTARNIPSNDAFTDPFASFASMTQATEPAQIGPVAFGTEGELLSLPTPGVDSTAVGWSAEGVFVGDQSSQKVAEPAEIVARQASAAGRSQQDLQAEKESTGQSKQAPSFTAHRSWGDGWADCVAESVAQPPDQATLPSGAVSSWPQMREEDMALEKALGCDRQKALLCLAQAAAGILVSGQQLWAEACSLGSPAIALGCSEVQQYLAALAHVRFVACAVDAALCCGAASAPSVEAELCRVLAQCEEAWQQSPSGAASLANALQELGRGDNTLATSARTAQEASQCVSQLQSAGKLDPAGATCPLTGLPHLVCPHMPLVELHARSTWAPVANLYIQHGPL